MFINFLYYYYLNHPFTMRYSASYWLVWLQKQVGAIHGNHKVQWLLALM